MASSLVATKGHIIEERMSFGDFMSQNQNTLKTLCVCPGSLSHPLCKYNLPFHIWL